MDDFEKLINASDLIEWIMETYPDWCVGDVRSIVDHVVDLPSAQPQMTRCAECIHWKHSAARKSYCEVFDWMSETEDFCSFAERRTDEGSN